MTITRNLIQVIRQEFVMPWVSLHGAPHWGRVYQNGLRLARSTGANMEVVTLFAFLHDAKRQNDGRDPEHGKRAAMLIRTLPRSWIDLSDHDLSLLTFACHYHTDGMTEADITIQTCWDADRLDLGRVGIIPVARHLCTPAAREPEVIVWALDRSRRHHNSIRKPS